MAGGRPFPRTAGTPVLLLLGMLSSGCTTTGNPSDYALKGKTDQFVPLTQAGAVVVRCHCPRRSVVTGKRTDRLEIHTEGVMSSYGYHGTQTRPDEVPADALRFHVDVQPGVVVLESREWTYSHHAMLLGEVRIIAPVGRDVRFEPIASGDLEGREVRGEDE